MPLGTEVGFGPGVVVLDGDPAPLKGAQPQFSAHVYCRQTAGWMKTLLGTEVDRGPGHIVLDGSQSPRPDARGTQQPPPSFRLMSIVDLWACGHGRPSQLLLSSCNI